MTGYSLLLLPESKSSLVDIYSEQRTEGVRRTGSDVVAVLEDNIFENGFFFPVVRHFSFLTT